jgi:hydrogenase small subunit
MEIKRLVNYENEIQSFVAEPLSARLNARGVSRRDFLKFCSTMAAVLALPMRYTERIAAALEQVRKPAVLWMDVQECGGCTESFLRAGRPPVGEIILELVSLNYQSVIMAAAGKQAYKAIWDTIEEEKGKYLVIFEGAIPTKDGGVYATIGGRAGLDIAKRLCQNAYAAVTVGACAFYGGWPAAAPNPTGAKGVGQIAPGVRLINIPGCPPNVVNITATLVYFLTFGELPATDQFKRPLFAFGDRIHDHCERRAHYDAGQYVEEWGDEGHRKGWCLYKMGCKGPATYHNCPAVRWNGGTSWPVEAGHGCIGCSEPHFWDTMSPFYRHLPQVPGFGVQATADEVGLGLAAVTGAAFAGHGVVSFIRRFLERRAGKLDGKKPGGFQSEDEEKREG